MEVLRTRTVIWRNLRLPCKSLRHSEYRLGGAQSHTKIARADPILSASKLADYASRVTYQLLSRQRCQWICREFMPQRTTRFYHPVKSHRSARTLSHRVSRSRIMEYTSAMAASCTTVRSDAADPAAPCKRLLSSASRRDSLCGSGGTRYRVSGASK